MHPPPVVRAQAAKRSPPQVQAFFVGDAYLGEDAAAYPTAQLALLARLPPALCAQLKQRAEARPRASWSLQAAALNAAILYTLVVLKGSAK